MLLKRFTMFEILIVCMQNVGFGTTYTYVRVANLTARRTVVFVLFRRLSVCCRVRVANLTVNIVLVLYMHWYWHWLGTGTGTGKRAQQGVRYCRTLVLISMLIRRGQRDGV